MHSRDGSERKIDLEDLMAKANGFSRSAPPRSEISFHPDKAKVVALGSGDGSVEVVDTATLRILIRLKTSSKLVQSLVWHPPGSQYEGEDAGDGEKTCCKDYWLAIAFSQVDIHVVNVEEYCQELGKSPQSEEEVPVKSEPDFVLTGHLQRVNELSWSPHEAGKLLSVSYDNSVQVWDVPTQQPIANVGVHMTRAMSCLWHPTDPDMVLSGSEDNTLRGWKISESINKLPQKGK